MRPSFFLPFILGICLTAACTKKATPEECQQAVDHMFELMQKESNEQMMRNFEQMGQPVPEQMKTGMAESFQRMRNQPGWESVHRAHLTACQNQPQTRVACILNATGIDELVTACGMKPSAGGSPRGGGLRISWP